jgi:hypothetical protein
MKVTIYGWSISRAFLVAFRDHYGQPLPHPSLLVRTEGGADGRALSRTEAVAVQRAVDLVVLDGNPPWHPDGGNEGLAVATSDNTELFVWPIDLGEGWVAIRRGVMVTTEVGGLRIGEALVVPPPLELSLPLPRLLDLELLEAAYRAFVGEHDDVDVGLARRLGVAVEWLAKAWRNSDSLQVVDRLVLLKVAFEALTDASANHEAARRLRELFDGLRTRGVTRGGRRAFVVVAR